MSVRRSAGVRSVAWRCAPFTIPHATFVILSLVLGGRIPIVVAIVPLVGFFVLVLRMKTFVIVYVCLLMYTVSLGLAYVSGLVVASIVRDVTGFTLPLSDLLFVPAPFGVAVVVYVTNVALGIRAHARASQVGRHKSLQRIAEGVLRLGAQVLPKRDRRNWSSDIAGRLGCAESFPEWMWTFTTELVALPGTARVFRPGKRHWPGE